MEGGSAFKPWVAPEVFISGCIQSQQTSAIRATSETRNTGQNKEKRKKKNNLKSLTSACEAYCLRVYSNNWRLDSHCTLFIEFFVSKSNCKSVGEQIGFWKAMEMEIMLYTILLINNLCVRQSMQSLDLKGTVIKACKLQTLGTGLKKPV